MQVFGPEEVQNVLMIRNAKMCTKSVRYAYQSESQPWHKQKVNMYCTTCSQKWYSTDVYKKYTICTK